MQIGELDRPRKQFASGNFGISGCFSSSTRLTLIFARVLSVPKLFDDKNQYSETVVSVSIRVPVLLVTVVSASVRFDRPMSSVSNDDDLDVPHFHHNLQLCFPFFSISMLLP